MTNENDFSWTIQLDWLNIINLLNLDSIEQISQNKKERAIKRITKLYGTETLLDHDPNELDKLVANELKELMKKELSLNAKKQEKREREFRSKMIPLNRGGIIKIDPRDFKDFDFDEKNPEEIMKFLYKKFFNDDDDDKRDDESDDYKEDSTGYYI